jgi:hypothetical protein
VGLERLDDMCRESMSEVSWAASDIRAALDAVAEYVGPQTWTGPPADRWSSELTARVAAIKRLLDDLPAEQRRLIEQARADQRELDRQRQDAVSHPGS